jgi:hypothetical protein
MSPRSCDDELVIRGTEVVPDQLRRDRRVQLPDQKDNDGYGDNGRRGDPMAARLIARIACRSVTSRTLVHTPCWVSADARLFRYS